MEKKQYAALVRRSRSLDFSARRPNPPRRPTRWAVSSQSQFPPVSSFVATPRRSTQQARQLHALTSKQYAGALRRFVAILRKEHRTILTA